MFLILQQEDFHGDIALQDVCFKYPARPEVRVLSDFTMSVTSGQTVALVGCSGCGKSTVVALIERFYDPLVGKISLDGTDLKNLNLSWLRSQIGLVSQEPVLFDASIAENIRYGANFRKVSDNEVEEAARAANIHSFIKSLPKVEIVCMKGGVVVAIAFKIVGRVLFSIW